MTTHLIPAKVLDRIAARTSPPALHNPVGGYLIDGDVCDVCSDDGREQSHPCPTILALRDDHE